MLEGMYSAAAGMAAQQQRMDLVADDLANVNTTGYKPGRIAFRDLVYTEAPRGADAGVRVGAGSASTLIGRSTQQGAMQQTDEPLDVALEGPGFLAVRLPDGRQALTRDGQLGTDRQGRLTMSSGELLDPAIQIPPGTDLARVAIDPDGRVRLGERELGRIRIVEVPAPGSLEPGPNNTFVAGPASGATRPATDTTLRQGALEASVVDMASAFAEMIEAQRGFEFASRAIRTQDQLLEIANGIKR